MLCVRVPGVRSSSGAAERRPNPTAGWGEEEDAERGDEAASGGESRIYFTLDMNEPDMQIIGSLLIISNWPYVNQLTSNKFSDETKFYNKNV